MSPASELDSVQLWMKVVVGGRVAKIIFKYYRNLVIFYNYGIVKLWNDLITEAVRARLIYLSTYNDRLIVLLAPQ